MESVELENIDYDNFQFSEETKLWQKTFPDKHPDIWKLESNIEHAKSMATYYGLGRNYVLNNIKNFEFLGDSSTTTNHITSYFLYRGIVKVILTIITIAIVIFLLISGFFIIAIIIIGIIFVSKKPKDKGYGETMTEWKDYFQDLFRSYF